MCIRDRLETLDNGKPIRETRDIDVPLAVRHFYHHAGWAQLLGSEFPQQRALGVVGQIVHWNFPLLMLAWKIAPALAGGNAVVFKPSEKTPATGAMLVECYHAAGIPEGVVRLLVGGPDEGRALAGHADIDGLLFTGSARTGVALNRQYADTPGKILALEMGGNNPLIVWDAADIPAAATLVIQSAFLSAGQRCTAARRLIAMLADESCAAQSVRPPSTTLSRPVT